MNLTLPTHAIYRRISLTCTLTALLVAPHPTSSAETNNPPLCRELRKFPADEAHQAVAVDQTHFFAITNRAIGKYDKATGKKVANWQAPADSPLKHFNSGVVIEGTLYCAHSNWPAVPTKNSIEIWNAKTLEHTGRKEFDTTGAMTWIDRRAGHWWVVFAHYGEKKSVQQTRLVKFNDRWEEQATWNFPETVIERFLPYSNSGGSWGPDGLLYVTGHDRAELYALKIPTDGNQLDLVDTVSIPAAGQGIAWDRSDVGLIYGIRRKTKEVVVSRLSHKNEFDALLQPVKWERDKRNPILPPGEAGTFDARRCMNPWVIKTGNNYQLYYSGGDSKGNQRIGLATSALDDLSKWERKTSLFTVGKPGAFDARWCVLPHVVPGDKHRLHLYYTGNAGRGSGLSAFPGIGLAVSDDGNSWSRLKPEPVLYRSGEAGDPDAIGMAGGSVIKITQPNGKTAWRFYYTGCPTIGKPLPLNQQKTICLATSDDGIEWTKQGPLLFRDPQRDYENIGVAGPVVMRSDDGKYRMWYSAIGTKWGYYSICYAESDDGIHWRRGPNYGDNLQLTPQGNGWEKQMVEYPSIIQEGNHLRMFYCGNGYGNTGIGTAVSVAP